MISRYIIAALVGLLVVSGVAFMVQRARTDVAIARAEKAETDRAAFERRADEYRGAMARQSQTILDMQAQIHRDGEMIAGLSKTIDAIQAEGDDTIASIDDAERKDASASEYLDSPVHPSVRDEINRAASPR